MKVLCAVILTVEDVMQGFWDHPAREIVRRVVGEWEDA